MGAGWGWRGWLTFADGGMAAMGARRVVRKMDGEIFNVRGGKPPGRQRAGNVGDLI